MENRQKRILDSLIKLDDFITIKELSDRFNVSVRTIHNDLQSIENKYSDLIIDKKRGVGVRLFWSSLPDKCKLQNDVEKRQINILFQLLYSQKPLTIKRLSEEYFVSQSSVLSDLDFLDKTYLKVNGIKLISNNKGSYVVGEEDSFQKTLMLLNNKLFNSVSYASDLNSYAQVLTPFYNKNVIESCERLVSDLENYNLYSVSNHYEMNIFSCLVVMIDRILLGYHAKVDSQKMIVEEVYSMKHYLIALDVLSILSQDVDFNYLESDIKKLSMYLQANRFEFKASSTYNNPEFDSVTRKIIQRFSTSLDIDLTKDKDLHQNLMVHLYHLVYRMKNDIKVVNPLLEEIKNHFRLLYDLTWLIMDGEKNSLGISITEDELGFLMLHFQTAIDRCEKSKRVLIVCPKGIVSSGFIVNRIKRILPPLDVIELTSTKNLRNYDLNDVSLIISTIPLEPLPTKVVIVSPLVNEEDLENISKAYDSNLSDLADSSPTSFKLLPNLLEKKYFFKGDGLTKELIIQETCEMLLKDKCVEKEYVLSVFERERFGGTDLETGAALPHGSVNLVNKTKIVIWTSESGIKWNNSVVYIIIFLVISKDDLNNTKQIMKEVYSLVKNKNIIKSKLRYVDFDILKDYLRR